MLAIIMRKKGILKLILPLSFGLFLFLSISLYLSMSPRLLLATVIEQIVVVVDGDPYTMTDLKDYVRTKSRRDFSTEELTQVSTKSKAVLEQFITQKLITAEVDRLGIKVSEENINEYIEKVKRRTRISNAQLRAALRRDGVKMEQYRASIRAEIEKGELINRQVEKKVNIIPEDVERYYQAHKKRFMTKGKVHLRHILIQIPEDATPEQEKAAFSRALKIRERALQGEDFSRLARKYSEGAGAPDGGDIGWVDRKSLLDEIAEVAFKSPPGEISLPVRTSLGVHLIKVEELQPAKLIPLSEVRTKIKKELFAKAMEERFQKWLKTDLRKRHRVDVKLPGFIFRAEKTKKRTIDSLLASASAGDEEERGFLSYLNPLSYFVSETPLDYGEGENLADEHVISLFGVPLFVSESGDDTEGPLILPDEDGEGGEPEGSDGFFSSILDSINPF